LPVGEVIEGPAIIEEAEATTVLLPEWTARLSPRGHLIMTLT
jgi:5-oxoprolinase (ATP-hydrolysing)